MFGTPSFWLVVGQVAVRQPLWKKRGVFQKFHRNLVCHRIMRKRRGVFQSFHRNPVGHRIMIAGLGSNSYPWALPVLGRALWVVYVYLYFYW